MNCITRFFVLLVALVACISAQADSNVPRPGRDSAPRITVERPDMEKIREEVNNPKSKYFYPKLMKLYESNDTTMNLDQYRHLYLGYIFQEDYDPYRRSAFDVELEELYYRTDHTRAELDSIIDHAELLLENNPFNLKQMDFLIYALNKRQKVNRAKIWQYRLNHLIGAILSTGTGLDEENAWIISDQAHEYFLLNNHGYMITDVEYRRPYYEYAIIKKDAGTPGSSTSEKSVDGYYFNLKYLLDEYYRKHPEQLNQ